jgi:Sulfotransferase family
MSRTSCDNHFLICESVLGVFLDHFFSSASTAIRPHRIYYHACMAHSSTMRWNKKVKCMWYLFIWMGIVIRTLELWRMGSNDGLQKDHTRELKATFANIWNHQTTEMSSQPVVHLTKQNISNEDRTILFVHIGKAGGETIKQILAVGCQSMLNRRRRSACFQQVPPSHLSNHVYGYYHCYQLHTRTGFRKGQTNKTNMFNTYLFNVRHPLERIQSWYNYVHPKHCVRGNHTPEAPHGASATTNQPRKKPGLSCEAHRQAVENPHGFVATFFQTCFPTLNDWAEAIQSVPNEMPPSPWSAQCRQLAMDSIHGNLNRHDDALATHLMANYRHYMHRTIHQDHPAHDVMVVRLDHLWTDLRQIDRHFFRGTGDFGNFTGTAVTHGSRVHHAATAIPVRSRHIFCCALQNELLLYRELIVRAINLSPHEQSATLQQAMDQCGFASWEQMRNDCSQRHTSANTVG